MKNHKKTIEYWYFPHKNSTLKESCYVFKYKKDLTNFLDHNFLEVCNGIVYLRINTLRYSRTFKKYFVWFKKRIIGKHKYFEIQLKNEK